MNKGMKYILGFIAIFIAAVICVFGIIKYEGMHDGSSTNNSANLGSVDGKQLSKETTIIIEKISTLNDIDVLNSELHLSQNVVDILKKYAPTVSYASDNSEEFDKIYFRLGGYYANHKTNDINRIIGSYKVDGGKLKSTGDDLDKIGSKVNGNDKLKWNNLNLDNKEHDKDVAKAIADKYYNVRIGADKDSMIGFGYLSDFSRRVTDKQRGITIVPMSLAEITDIYNTGLPETFNAEQVYKKLTNLKDANYKEVDDRYKGNEDKYNKSIRLNEVIYFKKDKMYLAAFGGIIGGAVVKTPAEPDKFIIEGDKVIVPLVERLIGGKQNGQMVLRLNNKQYEGGQSRSKYYVESGSLSSLVHGKKSF